MSVAHFLHFSRSVARSDVSLTTPLAPAPLGVALADHVFVHLLPCLHHVVVSGQIALNTSTATTLLLLGTLRGMHPSPATRASMGVTTPDDLALRGLSLRRPE